MHISRFIFLATGATADPDDSMSEVFAFLERRVQDGVVGDALVLSFEQEFGHLREVRLSDPRGAEVFAELVACFGRDAQAMKAELAAQGDPRSLLLWSRDRDGV